MRQQARVYRNCKMCGNEFFVHKYRSVDDSRGKFCSALCFRVHSKGQHRSPGTEFKVGRISSKGMLGRKQSEKHREAMRALTGEKHWNWKNRDYSESSKRWRQEHKIEIYFQIKRRRAMRLNADGSHTIKEWDELKRKYNYTCLSCMMIEPSITLTQDHIVPLSKGGSDYIGNIQPLCRNCNSQKWTF